MRRWVLISPLLLLGTAFAAYAQSGQQPETGVSSAKAEARSSVTESDCTGSPEQIRACGKRWYSDCLADWDAKTHMSKQEYGRVCRRVADERIKFLLQQRGNEDRPKQKSRQGS